VTDGHTDGTSRQTELRWLRRANAVAAFARKMEKKENEKKKKMVMNNIGGDVCNQTIQPTI